MKKLPLLWLSISALAPALAASQLPDQPVAPDSLAPEALAKFRAPLEATVTLEALTNQPSPKQSFTSGTNHFEDLNAINFFHGGFEPISLRPKLRATATHPTKVLLAPDHANAVAQGFYDGARVRVYQALDGKLTLIRDARVKPGGHLASGWLPYRGQRNTTADQTSYQIAFDSSFQPDRDYWFTVRSIDKFGRESENSNVVSARSPAKTSGQTMAQPPAPQMRFQENPPDDAPLPTPPGDLKAEVAADSLTLTWQPSASPDLAGYKVYVTGYDPAQHRGFGLELESAEPQPDRPIQERDIVFVDQFRTTLNQSDLAPFSTWPAYRNKLSSPFGRIHYQQPFGLWSDGSDGYPATWELASHPTPLPAEMTGVGQTCLHWKVESDALTGIPLTFYAAPTNDWYPSLREGTYTIEAWVRGSGQLQLVFEGPYAKPGVPLPYGLQTRGNSKLTIDPVDIPLSPEWKKVTTSFTVPGVLDQGLGTILLAFQGPGEFYMDNLRIFRPDHPYGEYDPISLGRINEMNLRYMRTHELIKTDWGYTLDGATNDALGNNYAGGRLLSQTFFTLLNNFRKAGNISPWLQVEMCLAEEEWLGFAEWLCAPYDPAAGDTPESKPWAYKRWSMGQKEPWIDVFPEFAFEVANETWNQTFAPYDFDWGTPLTDGATGRNYSYGETYGLFNEYVINQLRKSPYWSRAQDKMRYMLCAWQAAPAFGTGAATFCPSADLLSYAAYISTDGLGDPKQADDFKRFYLMQWGLSAVDGQSARNLENENFLRAQGRPIESGIYEYGLGFTVGAGVPAPVRETDQRLYRSIIGAVATLDAALTRYPYGMTDQAYFTFSHRIGSWGSHTTIPFGGHAYPFTKALQLYNQYGTGHFLEVQIESVPRWDFPEYEAEDNMRKAKRDARPDAPLASVFASAEGDRLTVFLISRKLDNFPIAGDDGVTPTTIRLPFQKAGKLTVHRLAGDPRTDDRFQENIKVETREVPLAGFDGTLTVGPDNGGVAGGLPPASILVYVFEGVDLSGLRIPPRAAFTPPDLVLAGQPARFQTSPQPGEQMDWQFGHGERSTSPDPTVTFPEAGYDQVKLTVTAANGRTAELENSALPVSLDFGGRIWTPRPVPPNLRNSLRATATADRLTLRGSAPLAAEGINPLLPPRDNPGNNYTIEATLERFEAPANARNPVAGLVLATNTRAGLGFGLHDFERTQIPASLLVTPAGQLVALSGQGPQTRNLDAKITLPARLRFQLADGEATASIEENGTWRTLATFPVPTNTAVFPALTTAAQGGEATSTWSNLQIQSKE